MSGPLNSHRKHWTRPRHTRSL